MDKFIGLATGCANGFQMPALGRHSCSGTDCNGDALWYAARMHGFFAGVAMLFYSAASAEQYGRRSFALPISHDADVRYTDVCRNLRSNGGCVLLDALTVVGGEILKRARTCYSEYLQCAGTTESGSVGYSFGIAHTPDGKCADTLSFPNFKAAASRRLKPHAESKESAERILWNTNRANFTKGNVGSRLGATEWPGTLRKCPKIACRMWREVLDKASDWSQY